MENIKKNLDNPPPPSRKKKIVKFTKFTYGMFVPVDVVLKCLNMDWELHRPFLQKAEVLAALVKDADGPKFHKYYRSPASETLDTYIKKNQFYSNDYKEMSNR